jgi:hypothetical protein
LGKFFRVPGGIIVPNIRKIEDTFGTRKKTKKRINSYENNSLHLSDEA